MLGLESNSSAWEHVSSFPSAACQDGRRAIFRAQTKRCISFQIMTYLWIFLKHLLTLTAHRTSVCSEIIGLSKHHLKGSTGNVKRQIIMTNKIGWRFVSTSRRTRGQLVEYLCMHDCSILPTISKVLPEYFIFYCFLYTYTHTELYKAMMKICFLTWLQLCLFLFW